MKIPPQVRIAFRNVFRNRRRTLITLTSILFGAAGLMNFDAYCNFVELALRESYIRSQLGHIQVYKKGYRASKGLNTYGFLINNPDGIKQIIRDALGPRLKVVTSRLEINGLVTKGGQSYNFMAQGVEVEGERRIADMGDGRPSAQKVRQGAPLTESDVGQVLMGFELCEAMGAREGELLSFMGTTAYGSLNALDLSLKGCFSTISKEYDKYAAIMPLAEAKKFAATEDVLKIVIMLNDTPMTDRAMADLAAAFKSRGLDLEMVSWIELADYYKQVMIFLKGMFLVIAAIIVCVVVFSIVNTLTMSVLERVQEIGTIRAMGAGGNEVIGLFVLEGIMLGLIGGFIGVIFGATIAHLVNWLKIMMPPPPGSSEGFYLELHLAWSSYVLSFLVALVSSLVASIYPAVKAARLRVVDALRHV